MKRLVAVVGPTGIGKSRLAVHLAGLFGGEIVSADSRQVYRYLDIGTAKPSAAEMALVPHHLIDVVNPDEDFSLAQYQDLAAQAISDIQRRGRLPFLVGGSGLYVWAVLEGWQPPGIPPDPGFRHNLEERARAGGAEELYEELAGVDPEAACRIDPRNVRRVIRALEVRAAGTASRPNGKRAPGYDTFIIGLTAAREELYRRVDRRVDEMVAGGLAAEVESLGKMGYDFNLPAMSGIGYRQIGQHLRGELSLEAAAEKMKAETHRLVRHQYAWFRLNDERIHWFDATSQGDEEIARVLAGFVQAG